MVKKKSVLTNDTNQGGDALITVKRELQANLFLELKIYDNHDLHSKVYSYAHYISKHVVVQGVMR